mmetsp:Transcript_21175/g.28174  ORF Transcript_21175/g.28174 Transcript_21175/m.28174 type:complete len:468 (+) Transcript_21175:275-1678(+)
MEINQTLNLNLGLPLTPQKIRLMKKIGKILSWIFSFMEHYIFKFWDVLPLRLRQKMTMLGWNIYLPLHRLLLGRRTAIHPDSSYEYHALSTMMWWSRFFPQTVQRIRFSLSQMNVWHPPEAYPPLTPTAILSGKSKTQRGGTTTKDYNDKGERLDENGEVYESWGIHALILDIVHDMSTNTKEEDGCEKGIVTGYFIQQDPKKASDKVLMWVYGGAFLGGDAKGNLPIAEKMGHYSNNMDVFIPDYRLLPEYEFHHALDDISLAYDYLLQIRHISPSNITLLGISSGGGLCTSMMQNIAKSHHYHDDDEDRQIVESSNLVNGEESKSELWKKNPKMPSGAVLVGPFVDYTEPEGSMKDYVAHDLIVNTAVLGLGLPYLDAQGNHEQRVAISPVYQSFVGLPPLCIVVSEHEAVYDQSILLANKARSEGVCVVLGVWKYMCHVFPLLCAFLPESRQSVDFMCDWIKNH